MRRPLLAAVLLLAWAGAVAAPPAPTNLQVDCGNGLQTNPTNCTDFQPNAFRWTDSSAFNRYEIRVDVAADFSDCWLWDPPAQAVTSTTSHSVAYPTLRTATDACGQSTLTQSRQAPWHGARVFYWRVRVSNDGGSTWSPYSTAKFMYEVPPSPPGSISVATSSVTGTNWQDPGNTSVTTNRYVDGTACAGNYSIANRNCTGSDGTSYTTIANCAAAAAAGDICWLRAGSYAGATITSNGTRAKPKTLKGYAAETANITSTLTLDGAYWVVDRVTFTSSSGASLIYSADNLLVQNCRFTGNGSSSVSGSDPAVIHIGGSTSNHFINNTASPSAPPWSVIAPHAGVDIVYRGNDITSGGKYGIMKTGDQDAHGNYEMTENYIHNFPGSDGACVEWYYATGEGFIARNYMHDCTNSGWTLSMSRGNWGTFLNNTWGRPGHNDFCYVFTYNDGASTITNDSCISTAFVFDFNSQWWHLNNKVKWTNSNYYQASGSNTPNVTGDGDCGSTGTNCIIRTGVTSANPSLSSGRPTSSSTGLIDLGDVDSPVPVEDPAVPGSVGTRVDIGKFEYGAAAIAASGGYQYQPRWSVADTTPRISWTFVDVNNVFGSAGQTQSAYEVQIDTNNHFNSLGPWTPLCSSGKVSSSQAFWDVPASCNLSNGTKYYVRVRTWDSEIPGATGTGLWSDYANAFVVGTAQSNLPPGSVTNVRRTDSH